MNNIVSQLPNDRENKGFYKKPQNGVEPLEFLMGLSPKDRLSVIQYEQLIFEHYSFAFEAVKRADRGQIVVAEPILSDLPPLVIPQKVRYQRLLIHRLCDYYSLERQVKDKAFVIIYNKNGRVPRIVFERKSLKDHYYDKRKADEVVRNGFSDASPTNRRVLKRDPKADNRSGSNSSGISSGNSTSFESNGETNNNAVFNSMFKSNKGRSFEEKQLRYERVRSNIFTSKNANYSRNALLPMPNQFDTAGNGQQMGANSQFGQRQDHARQHQHQHQHQHQQIMFNTIPQAPMQAQQQQQPQPPQQQASMGNGEADAYGWLQTMSMQPLSMQQLSMQAASMQPAGAQSSAGQMIPQFYNHYGQMQVPGPAIYAQQHMNGPVTYFPKDLNFGFPLSFV